MIIPVIESREESNKSDIRVLFSFSGHTKCRIKIVDSETNTDVTGWISPISYVLPYTSRIYKYCIYFEKLDPKYYISRAKIGTMKMPILRDGNNNLNYIVLIKDSEEFNTASVNVRIKKHRWNC